VIFIKFISNEDIIYRIDW